MVPCPRAVSGTAKPSVRAVAGEITQWLEPVSHRTLKVSRGPCRLTGGGHCVGGSWPGSSPMRGPRLRCRCPRVLRRPQVGLPSTAYPQAVLFQVVEFELRRRPPLGCGPLLVSAMVRALQTSDPSRRGNSITVFRIRALESVAVVEGVRVGVARVSLVGVPVPRIIDRHGVGNGPRELGLAGHGAGVSPSSRDWSSHRWVGHPLAILRKAIGAR